MNHVLGGERLFAAISTCLLMALGSPALAQHITSREKALTPVTRVDVKDGTRIFARFENATLRLVEYLTKWNTVDTRYYLDYSINMVGNSGNGIHVSVDIMSAKGELLHEGIRFEVPVDCTFGSHPLHRSGTLELNYIDVADSIRLRTSHSGQVLMVCGSDGLSAPKPP